MHVPLLQQPLNNDDWPVNGTLSRGEAGIPADRAEQCLVVVEFKMFWLSSLPQVGMKRPQHEMKQSGGGDVEVRRCEVEWRISCRFGDVRYTGVERLQDLGDLFDDQRSTNRS